MSNLTAARVVRATLVFIFSAEIATPVGNRATRAERSREEENSYCIVSGK